MGSQSLFESPTTYVVECGDIRSVVSCSAHWQEAVVISKKKVIISTLAPKAIWEDILTQMNQASPSEAIGCLRFRQSLGIKNTVWVKPLLLQSSIQINQQRASVARRGNGEQQKVFQQARLRVEGLPQVQHEVSCDMLMAKVSETCGSSFHKVVGGNLEIGGYMINYRQDGEFAQSITVQLDSDASLCDLVRRVHGSGIRINNRNLVVEVGSLHPNFSLAGNVPKNLIPPTSAASSSSFGAPEGGPCL